MRIGINAIITVFCVLLVASMGCAKNHQAEYRWEMHDLNRPRPAVVTPAWPSTPESAGKAPSDAIVLFDGSDLSEWEGSKPGQVKWKIKDDYMEIAPDSGSIFTRRSFGSCQVHVEWASPEKSEGGGQHDGNSGVFLMGKYEVQVLESFRNKTYADGQAAAIYGQKPPLVNACRPPGQWQSYDIIFHRPIFKEGKLIRPATLTMLHNGVLVHDNYELKGLTWHKRRPKYEPHADKLPISLQDHGNPVKYRNIWIRELDDSEQ